MEKERDWYFSLSLDPCDTWANEQELIILILITPDGASLGHVHYS